MNKMRKIVLIFLIATLAIAVGVLSACNQATFEVVQQNLHEGQSLTEVQIKVSQQGVITWTGEQKTLKAGSNNYTFVFEDRFGKKITHTVTLNASAHVTDEQSVIILKQPTCVEIGGQKHFCSICQKEYDMESIPALEHDFTKQVHVDGSCQTPGYTTYACSREGCDAIRINEDGSVFKLYDDHVGPHDYQRVNHVAGNCVEYGSYNYQCTVCQQYQVDDNGDYVVEEDGKLGDHVWQVDEKGEELISRIIKYSTCSEQGSGVVKCSLCDEEKQVNIEVGPHNYQKVNHVVGTCQTHGHYNYQCTYCQEFMADANGELYYESDGKLGDHVWQTDEKGEEIISRIVKDANCQEIGEGYVKCSLCDEEKFVYIDDGPHNYQKVNIQLGTCVDFGTYEMQCTLCGEFDCDEENNHKVFEDGVYGNHVWARDPITGEEISTTITHPTCQQKGVGIVDCVLCEKEDGKKIVNLETVDHSFVTEKHIDGDCHHYGYTEHVCAYECGTVLTDEFGEVVRVVDTVYGKHQFVDGFCTVGYYDDEGRYCICGAADVDNAVITFNIGANERGLNPTDKVVASLIPRDVVEDGNRYYDMFIDGEGGVYQHWPDYKGFPWYALDTYDPANAGLRYSDLIKSVVVNDGVTDLAKYMFQNCKQLEKATLCSTLGNGGSAVIPVSCFQNCTRLEVISSMPSNIGIIDDYAFADCPNLGLNTFGLPTGLQRIGKEAFRNNTKILYVDFRRTPNLQEVGNNAFHSCTNLAYVVMPAKLRNITIGGGCFLWSEPVIYVEDVYGTDWEKLDVFSTAYAYFLGTTSEKAFDEMVKIYSNSLQVIQNPNGYEITAFYRNVANNTVCYTVEGNVITRAIRFTEQDHNTSTIRTLADLYAQTLSDGSKFGDNLQMFGPECMALTNIGDLVIPASVRVICDIAFNQATLTSLKIPTNSQLEVLCRGAFQNIIDKGRLNLYLPNSLTSVGQGVFRSTTLGDIVVDMTTIPAGKSGSTAVKDSFLFGGAGAVSGFRSLTIGSNVKVIDDYAFANLSTLTGFTSIVIPDNVTRIGKGAFQNCTYLATVTLPNTAIEIGVEAFSGTACFTNSTVDGVTIIGNHLIKGSVTGSYVIPEGIITLADDAFYGCANLTVTLPSTLQYIGARALDGVTVASDGSDVYVNNQLVKAAPTSSVFMVAPGTTKIFFGAFSENELITEVIIPDTVTYIGAKAFYLCSNLTTVRFVDADGNNTTSKVQTIGEFAFYGCEQLKDFDFGQALTSLGEQSFAYCKALTEIVLPDTLQSIPYACFWACTQVKTVKTGDGVTNIEGIAFSDCYALEEFYVGKNVTTMQAAFSIYAYNNSKSKETSLQRLYIANLSNWMNITHVYNQQYQYYAELWYYTSNPALSTPYLVDYYAVDADGNAILLEDLRIDSSVKKLGAYSFANSKSLKTATFSFDGLSVGSRVFFRNFNMTKITVTRSEWDNIADATELQKTVWNGIVPSYFGEGINVTINFQKADGSTVVITGEKTFNFYDASLYDLTDLGFDSNGSKQYAMTIKEGVKVLPDDCLKNYTYFIEGYIVELTIPSSVATIKDHALDGGSTYEPNLWRIKKVTIVDTAESPSQLTTIGERAFFGVGATSFTMPSSVTKVGKEAFGANSITHVYINSVDAWCSIQFTGEPANSADSGFTSNPLALGKASLYLLSEDGNYHLLEEATITANKVGSYAFYNCNGLKKVTLTTNVKVIGDRSFQSCDDLVELYIETNGVTRALELGNYSFDRSSTSTNTIPLKVYVEDDIYLLENTFTATNGNDNSVNSGYLGAYSARDEYVKNLQDEGDGQ